MAASRLNDSQKLELLKLYRKWDDCGSFRLFPASAVRRAAVAQLIEALIGSARRAAVSHSPSRLASSELFGWAPQSRPAAAEAGRSPNHLLTLANKHSCSRISSRNCMTQYFSLAHSVHVLFVDRIQNHETAFQMRFCDVWYEIIGSQFSYLASFGFLQYSSTPRHS